MTDTPYREFPQDQIANWPDAPSGKYSLLRQKPGDLKEVSHLACWDARSGEAVDTGGEKIYLMGSCGKDEGSGHLESIVTDEEGKPFIMRYRYSAPQEEASLALLEQEAEKLALAIAARREAEEAEKAKAGEAIRQDIGNLKKQNEVEKLDLKNALALAQQDIENLRGQLETAQREIESLKKAREAEIAERRAATEAERQRQRDGQQRQVWEKAALWSSSIDTTMKRISDLQNSQLTFGKLVKVLDAMKAFYKQEHKVARFNEFIIEVCGAGMIDSSLFLWLFNMEVNNFLDFRNPIFSCPSFNSKVNAWLRLGLAMRMAAKP